MIRPMLSDRCPVCPVCDVGILWPNGWMDQDEPVVHGIVFFNVLQSELAVFF